MQADTRVGFMHGSMQGDTHVASMLDWSFTQLVALLPLWAPIAGAACFACRGPRKGEEEEEEGGEGADGEDEEEGPLAALPQARPRARACMAAQNERRYELRGLI
eukprot:5874278-Alexandrium_andersonii.AAC.1